MELQKPLNKHKKPQHDDVARQAKTIGLETMKFSQCFKQRSQRQLIGGSSRKLDLLKHGKTALKKNRDNV